ncbi:MAG TPA: ECF-type sigma factor [Gemmatales bacterium]|nr:ECF-type sigma factor [Gemmatales bacterium]
MAKPQRAEELLPVVYAELRRLAAQQLAKEKRGQTLEPTALVHEAYMRLAGVGGRTQQWNSRGHFFAAAARAMRCILIENARKKKRLKRGGGGPRRVELADAAATQEDERLLDLDEALTRLAAEDPIAASVVELRHYAGLGHEECAEALGITIYRARQKWEYAKAKLTVLLRGS